MPTATSLMLLSQGMGAVNSVGQGVGGYLSSSGERNLYRQDAAFAEMQAQDAMKRGDYEAMRLLSDARRLAGQQKVGFAASGVKSGVGSAAKTVEDTATLAAMDAAMLKNNAAREAFGYKTKAIDSRLRASLARQQGRSSLTQGILGAGKAGLYGGALYNNYYGLEQNRQVGQAADAALRWGRQGSQAMRFW